MLFDRKAKIAFVVACLTLIGSGVAFQTAVTKLNIYLRKEPVELREHLTSIHRHLGPWQAVGTDIQFDAATIETLGTDIHLDRIYSRGGGETDPRIALHIAYYTGMIDAIPHVPDRCMVAGGYNVVVRPHYVDLNVDTSDWLLDEEHVNLRSGKPYPYVYHRDPIRGTPITVRMPIGDFRVRVTEFTHPDMGDTRIYAGFFFIANGHITASPYHVRALAFDRTDKYAYYAKVQFTVLGDEDFTVDQYAEHVSEYVQHLLPELMRCLPDWSDIESREESDDAVTAADSVNPRQLQPRS